MPMKDKEEKIKEEEKVTETYALPKDVYETAEEAEERAKEMGGKGSHSMKIVMEDDKEIVAFMPFPTHDAYDKALKEEEMRMEEKEDKEKMEKKEEEEEVKENSQLDCDCEDEKPACDCDKTETLANNHSVETTFNLEGVEIFSTGVWNGDKYTQEDLQNMVENFDQTGFQPPLKLGHNEEQPEMLDGEPALGFVDRIYTEGTKLLADFSSLPKKVYEAIKRGNYKRVSSEIYWNFKNNGQVLDRVLKAVALLGSEIPAVTNLEAIEGLYAKAVGEGVIKKHYEQKESELMIEEEQSVSLKEYQELQNKVAELEGEKTKAIETLEQSKREQKSSTIKAYISDMKEEGKILPSFETEISALMESSSDEKVYSYTLDEKTIELSQFELIQNVFSKMPKLVNFAEVSVDGEFIIERKPYTNAGEEVDRRTKLVIEKGLAKDYKEGLEVVFKDDEQLKTDYFNAKK